MTTGYAFKSDVWEWADGGRAAAGFKGTTGDCVVRAIAIAARLDYRKTYEDLHRASKNLRDHGRCGTARQLRRDSYFGVSASPRHGVHPKVYKPYLTKLGAVWTPTMFIGSGCTVHLKPDELPAGRLICSVSRHLVAVIDGKIHDLSDCSRSGTRCVYGYWEIGGSKQS